MSNLRIKGVERELNYLRKKVNDLDKEFIDELLKQKSILKQIEQELDIE